MLSFSPFLVLGLVSAIVVQAASNLSSIIAQPSNWTVAGMSVSNLFPLCLEAYLVLKLTGQLVSLTC